MLGFNVNLPSILELTWSVPQAAHGLLELRAWSISMFLEAPVVPFPYRNIYIYTGILWTKFKQVLAFIVLALKAVHLKSI